MFKRSGYKNSGRMRKPKGLMDLLYQLNKRYVSFFLTDPFKRSEEMQEELHSHSRMLDSYSLLSISDLRGNIIFVNDKFCEVSKYTREEMIGQPHSIVRHPETPSSVFKEMWKKIGRGEVWQGEIKNKAKDGSAYWIFATIVPVLNAKGKPVKYISTRIDITHQKRTENDLIIARRNINLELFEHVNYAKQVHGAFLTNEEEIRNSFPNSFLLYKAQKIISGDFYGVYKQNNKTVIVVGDSTGHGVSASYISILALNSLRRTLEEDLNHPAEILQKIHFEMQRITNKEREIIETADTIICSIDRRNRIMNYASAKIRGIIIRNGEIIELKRDKCSIGEVGSNQLPLNKYTMCLEKKDLMYLFSDGIVDQFGGVHDKKFGYKNLKNLIKLNYEEDMLVQKEIISLALEEWKGSAEQTDDMTILGLQIE